MQNYSGQAKLDWRRLLRKPTIAWAFRYKIAIERGCINWKGILTGKRSTAKDPARIRCCLSGKGWRPTLWFQKASAQRQPKGKHGREAETAASPVTTELHGPWRSSLVPLLQLCAPSGTVRRFNWARAWRMGRRNTGKMVQIKQRAKLANNTEKWYWNFLLHRKHPSLLEVEGTAMWLAASLKSSAQQKKQMEQILYLPSQSILESKKNPHAFAE